MEASVFLGRSLPKTEEEMQACLPELLALGSEWVLLKGSDLSGDESLDVLFNKETKQVLHAPRIQTKNLHGTGCTLAAAIAALSTRMSIADSVVQAKAYVTEALRCSEQLNVGKGHGPLHHFFDAWKSK